MFNSLRSRLTLIFIGLAVTPLVITSIVLGARSFTTLEQEALDFQGEKAYSVGTEIRAFLRTWEVELQVLSEVRSLATLDTESQRTLLSSLLSYGQAYQELTLLDSEGQEVLRLSWTDVVSEDDLTSRAESEEFRIPATTGEIYYSPVRIDEATREPVITIAVPMVDLRSGMTSFVLLADMRFRTVWDFFANLAIESDEDVYLVDALGQVLAHRNPSVVLRETTVDLPDEDKRTVGLSGTDVILARDSFQLGNQEFVIVAEQPYVKAVALALNLVAVAVVITALVLIVAIGLVVLFVRQVVRPVERLSTVARSIREGDLSARAEVSSSDEIGELAQSFNTMTEQLSELIDNLEERVNHRTRDLQVAAEVSKQVATELNLETLLPSLVKRTRESFGLYAVAVFLYDQTSQLITLEQRGTGHGTEDKEIVQFSINDLGLVPQAARTLQPVVVDDVQKSPDYFANPSLPLTHSELAVPMVIGERVVGVMDFQSEELGYFKEDNIQVMLSLADQIAIAIQNAKLFSETQESQSKAEEANLIKSAFLASMSHELRTPLNSVINFTKFVVRGVMGPINERQEETLHKVVNSGQHLLALINDVLDMSKIESGSLNLFVEENINVNEIITTALSSAESLLVDKPVELRTEANANLPLIVGDQKRILQIVLNLLSNACKFTEEGHILLRAYETDNSIFIAIEDTGPGIAPEDHDAVFESFKQSNTGLRQGAGGTGLGLPISRSLTEAHGGKLWLESEPGKGTTFYVSLPVYSDILQPTLI